ncbi:DUF4397 domain-containing protein [Pedobacter sp. SYSU D00535]|uniref:DUF4397 domain-containing protein n=1 Tax=Pedobacter sp. SYSU D00535 TaxID=2810308 RepID=UPI001A96BE26|nr:DUF4397 domain-containing protein [Pedobacter sp. SYSU D00535]
MTLIKPLKERARGFLSAFCLALFSIALLSSCNKNDDDFEEPGTSTLRVVHAMPGTSSVSFYLNRQQVAGLLYSQSTPYFAVYSGNNEVHITTGGTQNVLATGGIGLKQDSTYSFFITTVSATNDSTSAIIIRDDLTAPSTGKAKVRFVHLIQNAPALDLATQGGNALFTNRSFRSHTQFVEVNPGTVTFQIKDAGTNNVRASSAQPVNIQAGKIYTVWAEGNVNGTDNYAQGVQVMEN